MRRLILKFHKGNFQNLKYRIDNKVKMHNTFHSAKQYVNTLKELFKGEILKDIERRLEEKAEEKNLALIMCA